MWCLICLIEHLCFKAKFLVELKAIIVTLRYGEILTLCMGDIVSVNYCFTLGLFTWKNNVGSFILLILFTPNIKDIK